MDSSKNQEIFDCPICLEQVNIPKYLPCLHTFCETCLHTYISSTAAQHEKQLKHFECPVCRRETLPPDSNISHEEWAKHFPLNHLIMSMSFCQKKNTETYCEICKRSEKESLAKHWCIQCEDPICDECKTYHSYVKTTKNHKILKLNDDINMSDTQIPDIDEPCDLHKGKFVEVYCKDHNKMCCSICFATQHRKCEHVEALDDVAKTLGKNEIERSINILSDISEKIENECISNQEKIKTLSQEKANIILAASKKVEESISLLKSLQEHWQKSFTFQHDKHVVEIDSFSNSLKNFQTTIKDAKRIVTAVNEKGSQKQLFITLEKLRQQIRDHIARLQCNDNMKGSFVVSYTHNVKDILKDVYEHGKVEDVQILEESNCLIKQISDDVLAFCSDPSQICDRTWLSKIDLFTCKTEQICSLNYTSYCYFAVFIDNRVILSNRYNKCVDVFNFKGQLLNTQQFPEQPYGMENGRNADEVYVSFGDRIEQYKIEMDGKFVQQMVISFQTEIHGFAFCGDNVVSSSKYSIDVSTTDGILQRRVSCCIQADVGYVAASKLPDASLAYINKGVLTCEYVNGTERFKLNVGSSARGVAFDWHGNIYVANVNQKKLKQIKADGKNTRMLLGHTGDSYNVVFHPSQNIFLVMSRKKGATLYKFIS